MKSFTKTFNIGEYAIGGRIKLSLQVGKEGCTVYVRALDWNTKKVVMEHGFDVSLEFHDLNNYLEQLSTSYYGEQMMNWIVEKSA